MRRIVNVEFAGLCLAVQRNDGVDLHLLDATAVGGPPHCATLVVPDHKGLAGAPDFAFASEQGEMAGWHLGGNVSVAGALAGGLTTDFSRTGDLGYVADTRSMRWDIPVTATFSIPSGQLGPTGEAFSFNFFYGDQAKGKTPVYEEPVRLYDRLSWRVEVDGPMRIGIPRASGSPRIVTINPETLGGALRISNITAGASGARPHFDVYYETLETPPRRPQIERVLEGSAQLKSDVPDNPDECRCMFVLAS